MTMLTNEDNAALDGATQAQPAEGTKKERNVNHVRKLQKAWATFQSVVADAAKHGVRVKIGAGDTVQPMDAGQFEVSITASF